MKSQEGHIKRIFIIGAALALLTQAAFAQESKASADDPNGVPAPVVMRHRKTAVKGVSVHRKLVKKGTKTAVKDATVHRTARAILCPTDFPIRFTAYDRPTSDDAATGTVMEISKMGLRGARPIPMYTKDLEGEQISSIVSWENSERTHFGYLVLTTPASGNLYSVMFFLYHDGKLTMPIDEVATGYPVFPSIKRSATTGQMQISFNDGSEDATNDQKKTVVYYTWNDTSHRFLKAVHEVAAESVERKRPRARKVEKTEAANGE
ncbi:MAG TPA: hypothetical protein VGL56_08050 [Fimbriimonadaceae bacterium]|jgi:hypothetical protein